MDDFFEEPQKKMDEQQNEQEVPKIKVGEAEYTQEELDGLVNLGRTAKEYEEKWNRPISEFYPDYTKKSQELAEIKKRQQEEETKKVEDKAKEGNELTYEEQVKLAREQAKRLGIVTDDTFREKVNEIVSNAMASVELINTSKSVISEKQKQGFPGVELNKLVGYMNGQNPTGTRFGTPEMAYNDMFSKEISQVNSQKVQQIKQPSMVTNTQNSQNREPAPVRPTRETLKQSIVESLMRPRG